MGQELRELLRGIPLFATLGEDELDRVLSRCRIELLAAGDWCVRAGDPADALYVVVYGRLQTYVDEELGDAISRGHVFGEIGMITRQPRRAGVRAIRDTQLLVLPAEEFDRLVDQEPEWLRRAAQIVTERLRAPSLGHPLERVLTLSVFTAGEGPGVSTKWKSWPPSWVGSAHRSGPSAADAPPPADRARWAHQLEGRHRYVLYDGSSGDRDWGEWCLGNCDRVVVDGRRRRLRRTAPPGRHPRASRRRRLDGSLFVVLVQRAGAERPRVSANWLDAAGDGPVLHLRPERRQRRGPRRPYGDRTGLRAGARRRRTAGLGPSRGYAGT